MKQIFYFTFFILIMPSLLFAESIEYQVGVDGVACPFCVYGIEKQLSKLDGIERIDADIDKGLMLVLMEDGATLSGSSIREAVNKAGFTLRSLSQRRIPK